MSVYRPKRANGSFKSPYWHFDFTIRLDGQRHRVHGSTGAPTKAEARKAEEAEKRRLRDGKPNDGMTLAAACLRYCEEVAAHQPSASDTEKALEHCCRLIGGGRRLSTVAADDIADAVRRRSAESYGRVKPKLVAAATVNRQIVEPMRRLLRRAKKVWGVSLDLDSYPWTQLVLKEPEERVREFSAGEAAAFWAALRPDYAPIVWFLANRGFRVRSAIELEKRRVDLAGRRVEAWQKGKGYVWRPLTAAQAAVLQTEMAKSPLRQVFTFELQRGAKRGLRRPITYPGLRRTMATTLKAAGIADFHIHDLRHDFASKLLRATRDLALVRKALGHAAIASTMRYAHVLDEDVAAGMEAAYRNSPVIVTAAPAKKLGELP